jgi:hypothetical protein
LFSVSSEYGGKGIELDIIALDHTHLGKDGYVKIMFFGVTVGT